MICSCQQDWSACNLSMGWVTRDSLPSEYLTDRIGYSAQRTLSRGSVTVVGRTLSIGHPVSANTDCAFSTRNRRSLSFMSSKDHSLLDRLNHTKTHSFIDKHFYNVCGCTKIKLLCCFENFKITFAKTHFHYKSTLLTCKSTNFDDRWRNNCRSWSE